MLPFFVSRIPDSASWSRVTGSDLETVGGGWGVVSWTPRDVNRRDPETC